MKRQVSIRYGCEIAHKTWYHFTGFTEWTRYQILYESFTLPEKGTMKITITCPRCGKLLNVKVLSEMRARVVTAILACWILLLSFGVILLGKEYAYYICYLLAIMLFGTGIWVFYKVIVNKLDEDDLVKIATRKHKIITDSEYAFYK